MPTEWEFRWQVFDDQGKPTGKMLTNPRTSKQILDLRKQIAYMKQTKHISEENEIRLNPIFRMIKRIIEAFEVWADNRTTGKIRLKEEKRKAELEAERKRWMEYEAYLRTLTLTSRNYNSSKQSSQSETFDYRCSYCNTKTNEKCGWTGCNNGVCQKCKSSGRAQKHYKQVSEKKAWHGQWARVEYIRSGYRCKKCSEKDTGNW